MIRKDLCYSVPLSVEFNLPRNKRNLNLMCNTVPSISALQNLSGDVTLGELPAVGIKSLMIAILPSTTKKGVIGIVHHRTDNEGIVPSQS